jgi:CBS domain-containing protein
MDKRTAIQSLSRRPVLTVSQHTNTYDAACLMTKGHCGSVLVVDDGALLGIFTERDLMTKVVAKALVPQQTLVADVMTCNPQTIAPDTSVSDAVLMMKECGFRHLPVMSESAEILGVFSMRDALPQELIDADQLAEHLDQQFSNALA